MAWERLKSLFRRRAHRIKDPIEHVVVLMFENHSFDQMLGCFQDVYPSLAGVDPARPRSNRDSNGREYRQRHSDEPIVDPDPRHELENILNHLRGDNQGFVSEYEREYPETSPDQRQKVMDYFGMGDLPALHALASEFTICDHWYSSVPGPTWTNRFFVHSGTSKGRVHMPSGIASHPGLYLGYDQDTIYDRLSERGKSWRVYYGDVPQSLVLSHQRRPRNAWRYYRFERFAEDAAGPTEDFPNFVFIEPRYFHIPFGQPQNDDHPPHSTIPAQQLLATVYNSLRRNAELWRSTLLVVLYDEHGGFYDHVSPPTAVPPDAFREEWTFDRLGVRVPAILASPWVDQRVESTHFDHTSVLKYLIEKWDLAPLTARVAGANSIGAAIRRSEAPRLDALPAAPIPDVEKRALAAAPTDEALPLNEHQQALLEFTQLLQEQAAAESDRPMLMRASAPGNEVEAACYNVEWYLEVKRLQAIDIAEDEDGVDRR